MIKDFITGAKYNLRGLGLALANPKLLGLGLLRLALTTAMAALGVALAVSYHDQVMELVWQRPQGAWIVWLWHLTSWILALVWSALASVLGYLVAQIVFSIFIMDLMSRITAEKAGFRQQGSHLSFWASFVHLVKQEIPRTIFPILVSLFIMILGWLTFMAPVVTVLMPTIASCFLAWENTDLVPARRLEPFSNRWSFFRHNLAAHLGFGVLFLVPLLNIVLLSYAPVGGTLLYLKLKTRS